MASADFALTSAGPEELAAGANRMLAGSELLQFAQATPIGGQRWRLTGLLRGRGGTEAAAHAGHAAGTRLVLLDSRPVRIDPMELGSSSGIAAIGLADPAPVIAAIADAGVTLRPLTPVHARMEPLEGGMILRWTRRSRGAWHWPDGVELPLNEQAEAYLVGLGPVTAPLASWETGNADITFPAPEWTALTAAHAGQPLWVRQVGSHALSAPLLLTLLP
jgi:hypothetical protein